jgi:hypothetical protein
MSPPDDFERKEFEDRVADQAVTRDVWTERMILRLFTVSKNVLKSSEPFSGQLLSTQSPNRALSVHRGQISVRSGGTGDAHTLY